MSSVFSEETPCFLSDSGHPVFPRSERFPTFPPILNPYCVRFQDTVLSSTYVYMVSWYVWNNVTRWRRDRNGTHSQTKGTTGVEFRRTGLPNTCSSEYSQISRVRGWRVHDLVKSKLRFLKVRQSLGRPTPICRSVVRVVRFGHRLEIGDLRVHWVVIFGSSKNDNRTS